jgi:hypothetical protein
MLLRPISTNSLPLSASGVSHLQSEAVQPFLRRHEASVIPIRCASWPTSRGLTHSTNHGRIQGQIGNLVGHAPRRATIQFTEQDPSAQKYRTVQRTPRVSIALVDARDPYRYLEIRGGVERIEPVSNQAFINCMAKKHPGEDPNPWHRPDGERVVIVVRPERTTRMGKGRSAETSGPTRPVPNDAPL